MIDPSPQAPLLQMEGIVKSFPGVQAVRDGRLRVEGGQVVALLGENGAGKSTLIKVLSGAHQPDGGTIRIDGRPVRIAGPAAAREMGVAVIYQEFNLVPTLPASDNLFLGREGGFAKLLDRRQERKRAAELFAGLGAQIDPTRLCRDLPVAHQQIVEIARAISEKARILVMDEPTSALTSQETQRLMQIIQSLRRQGLGIIYISHRLDEVFAIADRAVVMRDGRFILDRPIAELTRQQVIEAMVGRSLDQEFPRRTIAPGPVRLKVSGFCGGVVRDAALEVRAGQVLGITGLVGAGRTELARMIFGADRAESGLIELDGKPVVIDGPRRAIGLGICLLTEDRKSQGLILRHSVRDNFALPNLRDWTRAGFIARGREAERFTHFASAMGMRISGPRQPAGQLSGGNQQKVVIAKWLQRRASIVIFDEPTRGIDVGARFEIYQLINELAAQGKAIILISSELPEVMGMSDRLLVMRQGRIVGAFEEPARATQQEILAMAMPT